MIIWKGNMKTILQEIHIFSDFLISIFNYKIGLPDNVSNTLVQSSKYVSKPKDSLATPASMVQCPELCPFIFTSLA